MNIRVFDLKEKLNFLLSFWSTITFVTVLTNHQISIFRIEKKNNIIYYNKNYLLQN